MNSLSTLPTRPPLLKLQRLFCVLWLTLNLASGAALAADGNDNPTRHQLNRISDTLYQFTDGDRAGVVLLSDAGAVVVDPMNSETAMWLQSELSGRFQQDTRYVVYSSALEERISGAAVFAKSGATVIAHENTLASLQKNKSQTPPDVVFSDKLGVQLGSTTVDLYFFGKSLTDNSIAVHFPSEQAMYAGQIVAVEAFPVIKESTLAAAYMPEWFNTINRMNRIDFIYLLTAQNKIGIQHDGIRHGHFLRELHHRVSQALADSASGEVAQPDLTMDNYRQWHNQDQLPALVAGIRQLISQD